MLEISFTHYEAARATGIPQSTLEHFIKRGELRTVRIGRARVIRRSTLDEFLASYEAQPSDRDAARTSTKTVGRLMEVAREVGCD